MFKLMDKKVFTILHSQILQNAVYSKTSVIVVFCTFSIPHKNLLGLIKILKNIFSHSEPIHFFFRKVVKDLWPKSERRHRYDKSLR